MFKSLRVPANLFTLAMWVVSFVFASFLIGLGASLVADLPKLSDDITPEQFADAGALNQARDQQKALTEQLAANAERRRVVRQDEVAAANAYQAARQSFENWVATRKATSNAEQDPEVVSRTRELDRLKTVEAEARARLDALQAENGNLEAQRSRAASDEARVIDAGQAGFERARFRQELTVFGARLALTLPLLVLAGWMVAQKRRSEYWPLYRGFIVFAVFTFFVELVPYLPSYGGYVRSVAGIVATVLAGHYAVRWMRRYLAAREAAAQQSEAERRRSLSYEDAIKKLGAGLCPGCERPASAAASADGKTPDTNFCAHCGLKLFSRCGSCQTRKNAFFHYCPSCGTDAKVDAAVAA
jgi:hypothetical protein